MKMIKILDAKGMVLISDALNQMILEKLVKSQCSVTQLSRELNIPTLKIWRRIERLQKSRLVEVTSFNKIGNLEQKLYRATALRYELPSQFSEPKLNNPNLMEAFKIYTKIQNEMMNALAAFDDKVPKEGDPVVLPFTR